MVKYPFWVQKLLHYTIQHEGDRHIQFRQMSVSPGQTTAVSTARHQPILPRLLTVSLMSTHGGGCARVAGSSRADNSSLHSRRPRLSCRGCARMEQSTAHCDISDVITDVQAAAEDSAVRPLLPLAVLLRPFASVFCLTL